MNKAVSIIIAFIASIGLLICTLAFGSPQWNRWIYRFQSLTGQSARLMKPPSDFTGIWYIWTWDTKAEVAYKNGLQNGLTVVWYTSGQKCQEISYLDDRRHGKYAFWNKKGQQLEEGFYVNGLREGRWTTWNEKGEIILIRYYKDGEEIKEEAGESKADEPDRGHP